MQVAIAIGANTYTVPIVDPVRVASTLVSIQKTKISTKGLTLVPSILATVLPTKAVKPVLYVYDVPSIDHQKLKGLGLKNYGYITHSYAAVEVLAKALQNNKILTSEHIANYLHYNKFNTALGTIYWDSNGELFDHNFKIFLWNNENSSKPA